MAELKHTFTSGRMNKDLDERLIPNGEYIDAQNIQISSSEGSDVGAIENLFGNGKLSQLKLKNAKTLGSIAYNLKNKIYWIVTSDTIDGIYEYDEKQKVVSPILIDKKETNSINLDGAIVYSNIDNELILENFNPNTFKELIGNDIPVEINEEKLVKNNISLISYDPYIKISIPKNTVVKKNTNGNIEFKNIEYNGKKYGGIDLKAVYTSNGVLNLSKNNLITGINIVDDLLFWTDNLNQPRRINISSFKKYTNNIFDQDTQIEYAKKDPTTKEIAKLKRNFTEDDISVIKKSPMYAPAMELYDSVTDGKVDIKYTLNLTNVYVGQIFTLNNLPEIPDWKVGDFVTIQADGADFIIDASVKTNENSIIEINVATLSGEIKNQSYDCNIDLKQKKPLYELNFVRFAYRWKYKNGEYSTLSPFTSPAFYPDEFVYDGKEAFNYGMINKLQRVVLNNFDLGNDDISEIDILFKEGRNQNIYVLKTIKKLDFTDEYIVTKEQIHSVIPNDQLLRAWDNVPKRAKAQEITANRIIYGNYTQNYDVYNEPEIKVSTVARDNELNRSIKSNRTYQIGVSYIDEYNRHTPVLSNDSGAFEISKDNSVLKNQFSLSLANKPPAWAKYFKYYIKDTSGEYYNLSADKFYQDIENGFTYISFPSSDRNKVTNDHYLILKKKHGSNEAVLDKDNRYKIIDIFSDPPEFITSRKKEIYSVGDIVFTTEFDGPSGGVEVLQRDQSGAGGGAPVEDYNEIQIKGAGGGNGTGGVWDGVPAADANEFKPGRFIKFKFGSKESDIYEIKNVQQHTAGSIEMKITFTEPFGDDVAFLFQKVSPFNLGNTDNDRNNPSGISISILEEYTAAGDKEFDGRFFIKLKSNTVLEESIVKETIGGISYLAKESILLNGIYPKKYDSYRNDNNYKNSARYKDNALTEPPNNFIVSDGGSTSNGSTAETGKYLTFGSLDYNITLEQSTHKNDSNFLEIARKIKVGDFVRFKNPDGTNHHDTVYEIGAVKFHDKKDQKQGNTSKRTIKCVSLHFINENGEFKPLDKEVCVRNQNTTDNEPIMEILQEINEENIIIKDPAIFETEPLERKTELDIYYETEKAISIDEHGQTHTLDWYNTISFGNGVESNRIRDDFNAIFIDTGVRASTVLAEPFKEEHKFNGLIWSGIINSRSGTNQSNQFNMANPITKDLLPSYGSVQKLFARDGDIVIYCEDKILRAQADKDILYNADGSANVIATNRVIGGVIPFAGEYGISQNPESFAFYGFRAYHADPKRGVILRLSQDGLTPISAANMSSYFRNSLFGYDSEIIGSYDNRNKLYNISYNDRTVCFSEDVNGWVTFKSFYPQNGISLNNIYYTYSNGQLWQHDLENAPRNNFYGEQYDSFVELNINDNPSVVKKYKTLGYEGTEGWLANITTDQQISSELSFKEKENKYFVNITGESKALDNIDAKNFSVQGIGRSVKKTTISFATGDVVVGQNGEIIILGGGNGIIGPDYIITGDNIDYDINDNGDIIVTGNNIGGGSGTGNTTGGDTVGTGGGTVEVNDTGGSGSDNTGGGGTGDFTDTGGDGVGVDTENDYSDQLGDVGNTTATFNLDLNSSDFFSKDKLITQKPGENISQVVFTIYPQQGYNIFAADFNSDENINFVQSGENIKATLVTSITHPNEDKFYTFKVTGSASLKPLEISGNITLDVTNATVNNDNIKTYAVSGDYGEEKIIAERIITAGQGYYLTSGVITVDNNNVYLQKIKLSDASYKIIETVFIPKNTTTNNDYTITVNPLEIVLPDPKIISKTLKTDVLSNNGEDRTLIINGQENAEFEVIISDTSSTILKQKYILDATGKQEIPITFDSGDTAETYTIKINTITGTDIDSNFGAQTITLVRNAKGRKTASFLVNYSSTINNNFTIENYIGQSTSRKFSFNLTLPSGTYTIGRQPSANDIAFGNNANSAFVLLDNIFFDAINTNVLTISGTLFVSNFQEDETYTLDISSYVGADVTTTFAYTTPTSDYTVGATSYTVDGGAGLSSTPSVDEYFFTLTPAATYSFKTDIDADDFELLDSSNNDVSADYAANGEILLRKVGNTLEIGFKTKTFIQPNATSTFTLKPKTGVVLTETTPTATIPIFFCGVDVFEGLDGTFPSTQTFQTYKPINNLTVTGDNLLQIDLPSKDNIFDSDELSDSSLYYIENTNAAHITLATAGTYGSTTITGPFELSSDKKSLTINLLINLSGDSSLTSGIVNIYVNRVSNKVVDNTGTTTQKYYLVEVKIGGCDEQDGGPNEGRQQWSPIVESDERYPKYYSDSPTLIENGRLYARSNSSIPIPGILANTFNVIQKGNPNLFQSQYRNVLPPLDPNAWLTLRGVCSLDGSHMDLFTNSVKHNLYNDIIKYSYPIKSDIFKNEKQTLTGNIVITDRAAYDALIQDISSKGYNIKPISGVNVDNNTLTFTYDAYFDNNGNSSFDFELLRAADEWGVSFEFDNTNDDSPLNKLNGTSYEMRRSSDENQDNNDHIPPNELNSYNLFDKYYTNYSLDRYDDGSGNYDGSSARVTDNSPQSDEFGYTGDVTKITQLPDSIIVNDGLVKYLNGNSTAALFTEKFTWNRASQASASLANGKAWISGTRNVSTGPLSGTHLYMKTGFTVLLEQPTGAAILEYYDLWQKINDGQITSLKIPIDLQKVDSSTFGYSRNATERLFTTTVDLDGGYAALEENGWWDSPSADRTTWWKNYYIGDNIYISETTGDGLQALPNYSGIQFTFGVTIKVYTDNKERMLAFGKLPFTMGYFKPINGAINSATQNSINYAGGNGWNYKDFEPYNVWYISPVKNLIQNTNAYGVYNKRSATTGRYIKFRT